jgi:hypothetical protein
MPVRAKRKTFESQQNEDGRMSRAQRHTATVAESHGDRAMVTVTVTVVNSKLELLPIYQSRCHIMPASG